jgi:hypothetical protein
MDMQLNGDKPESDLPTHLAKPAQRALARAGYLRRAVHEVKRGRGPEIAWYGSQSAGSDPPRPRRQGTIVCGKILRPKRDVRIILKAASV